MRHSGSPRACFCWARLVSGGSAVTLCRPAAKSLTARFGATASPLADARGSDRSPDREGGVAPNSTTSHGHSTKSRRVLILPLPGSLCLGPAGALRVGDTRSSLGTHPMLLFGRGGFTRALGCRRRGRRLSEHAA